MNIDPLLADLPADHQQPLRDYLTQFVTEERQLLIQRVLERRTRHLAVVLENIYQPHNASAVLRSCDLFGVQDVYVIETTNEYRVNRDVALGASQWLTLRRYGRHRAEGLRRCADELRAAGYRLAATTLRPGSIPVAELSIDQKTALMFGTEMHGLSEEAHDLVDVLVHIPMEGFTQSFNISVSAALCLYELSGRLRRSQVPWELAPEEKLVLEIGWLVNSATRPAALLLHYLRQTGVEGDFGWLEEINRHD